MTRYQIDGYSFPIDPITKRWRREQIASGGTGQGIYAAFWQIELSFPPMETQGEVDFFQERWLLGGLHTALLPHPKTGAMCGFTGVNIVNFDYGLNDVESDGWTETGPRLTLGHINLSATGTV